MVNRWRYIIQREGTKYFYQRLFHNTAILTPGLRVPFKPNSSIRSIHLARRESEELMEEVAILHAALLDLSGGDGEHHWDTVLINEPPEYP